MLPSLLLGLGVINFTVDQIKKLQVIENSVYRMLLGGAPYATNATLRGEIGASLMESRDIETRLTFIKGIMEGDNELVKEVLINTRKMKKNEWNQKLEKQMKEVGIRWEEMEQMSKEGIKRRVRKSDNKKWEKEVERKSTISLYKEYKKEIKDENIYDNRECSRLLYWARSNTLKLNDWNRHQAGGKVGCIIKCKGVEGRRN